MADINLGHATAYGYARSKGFSGTEEEFAQLMANYGTIGQTATQAAQTATTKASEAASSASNAALSATNAANSAQEAADIVENIIDDTLTQEGKAADAKVTGDRIGELKDDINQLNSNELAISQGYWAIADGAPATSANWCRSDSYIPHDWLVESTIEMFLMAYSNGVYVGTWDGTAFTTTLTFSAYMESVDIGEWSKNYPAYQFKLLFYGDGSAITPADCLRSSTIINKLSEENLLNRFLPIYADMVAVEQGYWAVADGKPKSGENWCRTATFVPNIYALKTNSIYMVLCAYNKYDGSYVGAWNGSTFVTSFGTYTMPKKSFVIPYFTKNYADYIFKIDFYNNGSALSVSDVYDDLEIVNIIDDKQNEKCSNLIGNDFGAFYPVTLTQGMYLTFSTSDGAPIGYGASGSQVEIAFYDAHKNYINYYGFPVERSSRTVGPISAELATAKYIGLYNDIPRVPIMVNVGDAVMQYEDYFLPATAVTKAILNLNTETADSVIIHKSDKDFLYAYKRHFGTNESADNDFKIMWVSDIHAETSRTNRMVDLLNAWGTSYFDIAVNTGDTVLTLFSQDITWYDDLVDESNIPILNTVGNHDAWLNLNGELANKVDVYNKFIAPVASHTSIVQPENASTNGLNYYYKDVGGIRLIVLDCMYYDSAEQTWFESVLADAHTNSLPVIACSHAPFESQYCHLLDSIWNVGWFHRDSTKTNIAMAQAVKDFETDGGTFICWLVGHIHGDEIEILPNYGNQLVLCTNTFQDRGTTVVKNTGKRAYNYDSLTFITVDDVNHTIKMYRIGANIDTAGHRRNGFVWDYVNKQLITEW